MYTQESFRAAQLQPSAYAPDYFTSDCTSLGLCSKHQHPFHQCSAGQLKKNPYIFRWSFAQWIDEHKVVSPEECEMMAKFLERCLHLNPEDRATAAELVNDPWLDGVS